MLQLVSCKARTLDSYAKQTVEPSGERWGVWFKCDDAVQGKAAAEKTTKFIHEQLGWATGQTDNPDDVTVVLEDEGRSAGFFFKNVSVDTINIAKNRPALKIADAKFTFYRRVFDDRSQKLVREPVPVTVDVVSVKEIAAGLFSRGRITEFTGNNCSFESFFDHIAMRQNVVAWTIKSHLTFPEAKLGEPHVNRGLWDVKDEDQFARGYTYYTVKDGVEPDEALRDTIEGVERYEYGCLYACREIMVGSMADYFSEVKAGKSMTKLIAASEKDIANAKRPYNPVNEVIKKQSERNPTSSEVIDQVLDMQSPIAAANWIAGDWGYVENTDPYTAEYSAGDEGCNVIYIGRSNFGVYYDNGQPRSFKKVLCRVYNWRFTDAEDADNNVKKIRESDPSAKIIAKPNYNRDTDYCDEATVSDDRVQDMIQTMLSPHRKYPSTNLKSDLREERP